MDINRLSLLFGACAIAAITASAEDEGNQMTIVHTPPVQYASSASIGPPSCQKPPIVPRIHLDMPEDMRARLRAGFAINASNTTVRPTASITPLPSSTDVVAIDPWIHGGMDEGLRQSVEVAFEIAAERVKEVESCSDLFTEFGVDAMEALDRAVYMPIFSRHKVKKVCGRNLAYTFVGAPSTFICPKFERVSDQHAAMVIIHEALHTAGLEEAPTNSGAKTSQQINSMVAKSCHF